MRLHDSTLEFAILKTTQLVVETRSGLTGMLCLTVGRIGRLGSRVFNFNYEFRCFDY